MINLYPFQRDGVEYALAHHYTINACEMGLGKSAMAIAVMNEQKGPTLIVCPAYLKTNWQNEVKKFSSSFDKSAISLEIESYDQFAKNGNKGLYYSMVIFDEAHYLKNMQAKRTKAAHEFVKKSKPEYIMLLTGTPIKNRVCEFYSLLKLCSYNPKGTSGIPLTKGYHVFADALSHKEEYKLPNGIKIVKYTGLKNKPLLLKYLEGKYFRRLAADELDLPPITESYITCKTPELDNDILAADFEQNNSLSTTKKDSALAKAEHTVKFAGELLEQDIGPLLIFTDHVGSAERIYGGLSRRSGDRGRRGRRIMGSTPTEERAKYVEEFQQKKLDFLVCTVGSMSTGFTLTATNRIIFNDLSWCPADNAQAAARIHRIGQKRPCFITYMVSSGVDEKITRTLQEKKRVLNDAT